MARCAIKPLKGIDQAEAKTGFPGHFWAQPDWWYIFAENSMGLRSLGLHIDEEDTGTLFSPINRNHALSGLGHLEVSRFPKHNYRCAASALGGA